MPPPPPAVFFFVLVLSEVRVLCPSIACVCVYVCVLFVSDVRVLPLFPPPSPFWNLFFVFVRCHDTIYSFPFGREVFFVLVLS